MYFVGTVFLFHTNLRAYSQLKYKYIRYLLLTLRSALLNLAKVAIGNTFDIMVIGLTVITSLLSLYMEQNFC